MIRFLYTLYFTDQ